MAEIPRIVGSENNTLWLIYGKGKGSLELGIACGGSKNGWPKGTMLEYSFHLLPEWTGDVRGLNGV